VDGAPDVALEADTLVRHGVRGLVVNELQGLRRRPGIEVVPIGCSDGPRREAQGSCGKPLQQRFAAGPGEDDAGPTIRLHQFIGLRHR
jgi:hypothetical protein